MTTKEFIDKRDAIYKEILDIRQKIKGLRSQVTESNRIIPKVENEIEEILKLLFEKEDGFADIVREYFNTEVWFKWST